jgi:dethiobiotin synthetase/adenosylmethionine--8-amino-7-oxononanoate aminotransferase
MKFVDPLWQRALIDVARNKRVPVIFDEVATGLYRLGVKSCREIIGVNPDIAAYAKLLTGGLVPMSVTLASDDIFSSFVGDSKSEALLHGHSYSAHPVGCIASIHALEAYNDAISLENRKFPFFDELHVAQLSTLASVEECMSLGTVLALKVRSENGETSSLVQSLVQRIRENGCFIRPLGDIIYVMTSFVTERDECSTIIHLLQDAIIDEERNQKKNYVHQSNSLCVV